MDLTNISEENKDQVTSEIVESIDKEESVQITETIVEVEAEEAAEIEVSKADQSI